MSHLELKHPDCIERPEMVLLSQNRSSQRSFRAITILLTDSLVVKREKTRVRIDDPDDPDDSQRSRQAVVSESSGVSAGNKKTYSRLTTLMTQTGVLSQTDKEDWVICLKHPHHSQRQLNRPKGVALRPSFRKVLPLPV